MSANEQNNRPKQPRDLENEDLNLDLELERVIKHLDEAISEPSPDLTDLESMESKKPAAPTARAPIPARDPKPAPKPGALPGAKSAVSSAANPGSKNSDTVLLTDRLADSVLAAPSVRSAKTDVLDLVDEIYDNPYPSDLGDDPPQLVKTVADLLPEELGEIITQAVERALRNFFAR